MYGSPALRVRSLCGAIFAAFIAWQATAAGVALPAAPDAGAMRVPALPGAAATLAGTERLIIPVAGVRPDKLTDNYNDRRGGTRTHEALDIMAPRGTPVVAVADGRIVKLFNSRPGGLTVYEFDAGESVAYYYAHLDHYAAGLYEGKAVAQGEVIGYVGTTGNAPKNTPHLHFQVMRFVDARTWWNGPPFDPRPYLAQAGDHRRAERATAALPERQ